MSNMDEKHKKAKWLFFKYLAKDSESQNWSNKMLKSISNQCNFTTDYHIILFPDGLRQIACEFDDWQNEKMLKYLKQETPKDKVREKIARALEIRLIEVVSKICLLKQQAFFLEPANICQSVSNNFRTCDLIWRYAGDESTDFNYYTKRVLLMGVYLSAKLFYQADESKNYSETKEFIRTSLDDIINIAKVKSKIKLPNLEDIPLFRMFA